MGDYTDRGIMVSSYRVGVDSLAFLVDVIGEEVLVEVVVDP